MVFSEIGFQDYIYAPLLWGPDVTYENENNYLETKAQLLLL